MAYSQKKFLLFPGQGAQRVGMTLPFTRSAYLREALVVAEAELDLPLGRWMAEGPANELMRTQHAQPALLVLGYAIAQELLAKGLSVEAAAGHSLGELTALTVARALDFNDAVRLAYLRGQAMQQAVPEGQGGMLALLGAAEAQVNDVLAQATRFGVVVAANFNAPGHTVVSGERSALSWIKDQARVLGIRRVIELEVSAPFHSPLMAPAAKVLAAALDSITVKKPQFTVWSNADLCPHGDPAQIRDALVRQVTAPVHWIKQVQNMRSAVPALELPPGKVLVGLIKRIAPDWVVINIESESHTLWSED